MLVLLRMVGCQMYLQAGVQVVWNVYPAEQTVDVVGLGEHGELLTWTLLGEQLIDGGNVLPSVSCKVAQFFQ